MNHYTFSTFETDESNRLAYAFCRDAADLHCEPPMPVVLVADKGCGKTHLLSAIVNQVRAASSHTAIAYITANAIPQQVLDLFNDPTPIAHADHALLLVDQLEQFTDTSEVLEALVQLFRDHGHAVIMASAIHPLRLPDLSPGLVRLIKQGRVIAMGPHTPALRARLRKNSAPEHADGDVAALKRRSALLERALREMRDKVRQATQQAAEQSNHDIERLRDALEQSRMEVREVKQELAHRIKQDEAHQSGLSTEHLSALREQIKGLRNEYGTKLKELGEERAEALKALKALKQEYRTRATQLGLERDRAKEEVRTTYERASRLIDRVEKERETFRSWVENTIAEIPPSRERDFAAQLEIERLAFSEERDKWQARLDAIEEARRDEVQELEGRRRVLLEERAVQDTRITELEERLTLLAEQQREAAQAAAQELEALRDSVAKRDEDLQALRLEAESLAQQARQYAKERAELAEDLASLRTSLVRREEELERARVDAERQAASSQAQRATAERHIAEMEWQAKQARVTRHDVARELTHFRDSLVESADLLARLTQRIADDSDATIDSIINEFGEDEDEEDASASAAADDDWRVAAAALERVASKRRADAAQESSTREDEALELLEDVMGDEPDESGSHGSTFVITHDFEPVHPPIEFVNRTPFTAPLPVLPDEEVSREHI